MAERRMFAKTIIDSDAFLDMPLSTQSLYFHLSMRADDDGFINNPKKIQRMVGGSEDDLKLLIAKSFIIPFESGVVVIKHWKIHNYIRSDRYRETVYSKEKSQLFLKENNAYTLSQPEVSDDGMSLGIPNAYQRETQDRIGKDRLVEDSNIYSAIVSHLNEKTGSAYKASSRKTQSLINARINEGFALEDFLQVIDNMCAEWMTDSKMQAYLRPETLFGTKFESYLNRKTRRSNQTKSGAADDLDGIL
ncbi:MAG: conserved phage C-terminal domain-containing protein [Ruminococcus sp.]|nr:conserved phage C-terminal domain-containing protein [Ruminococcus sp.]